MIKLVIFDFDDTLSMTEEIFFRVENQIAEKMGFAPMSRRAHQKNWGQPVKKAILERIPGIDPDEFMRLHQELMPDLVKDKVVDHITDEKIQTLKTLKRDGLRMAILTSRLLQEAEHLLNEEHHVNKYIEKIYHADNSDFLKPDPRVFDKILAEFKTDPRESVYVGDSLSDAISAKGAGLHFIAYLENGLRKESDFESVEVDYFTKSFPKIIEYIEKN